MKKGKEPELECTEFDCIFTGAKYCEACPIYKRAWHALNDDFIAAAADDERKKQQEDRIIAKEKG